LGKYTSTDRGLTLKGFKEFWKASIKEHSEAQVWVWLRELGFDHEFYSSFSRSFIFTIHCEQPVTLQVGDNVSTNLEQATQSMILREYGTIIENKSEVALL
jgi:hypothetical protein